MTPGQKRQYGERLRHAMVIDLARRAGVSHATAYRWMADDVPPKVQRAALATLLESPQLDPPDDETTGADRKAFAARLRHAINERNAPIAHLAELTGYGPSTVYGWAAGKAIPRERAIYAIAKALRVTPTWLRTGRGTNPFPAPESASR
jgi:predicted DNA-binding transcriptional regulator AlpA